MNQVLEDDVQALKERVVDTQALYREVCALLFFRYGETPTANKLYQLVRRGSMSAPAKALRDFWSGVRDQSRVDIGQPDLPPEVAKATGELVVTLWRLANQAAGDSFATLRNDLQLEANTARQRADDAEVRCEAALVASQAAEDKAVGKAARIAELEAQLLEQQTANAVLRGQLNSARDEANTAAAALVDARRDFSTELEKLRQSISQNEQRLIAAEKRALLEIDSERTVANRAKKDLQAATDRFTELESTYRSDRDAMRDELTSLKARLASAKQLNAGLVEQLTAKDTALAQRNDIVEVLRQKLDAWTTLAASAGMSEAARRPTQRFTPSATGKQRRNIKLQSEIFKKRRVT
ncbi:DNA-binding protein [Burkholderia pyrrocinia]|uniref:DNA-binding protein n=1 Tax=Burkholderia pyrrocinia TaxID=60550 RepID=UPI001576F847|nr:DNA-binding protein [Burkholderia pyrrocinia]NTX26729.1 DNA-binding protein [Burkholderia pyrrocinia]